MKISAIDTKPKAKVFRERIGNAEYELREEKLDIFDDVFLWDDNPRLLRFKDSGSIEEEIELEAKLRMTPGYAALAKSISEIGQLEPIYAWKREDLQKHLTLDGATRVTILRDLARKNEGKPEGEKYRAVKAKILNPEFSEEERVILLARIHVRGTGVRSWGRYVEARFVYETVVGKDGGKPIMNVAELARHMGKSSSWVSRLKDAYEFALKFVDHFDTPEAKEAAAEQFSILEEISKARIIGPKLKDYDNHDFTELRADVFGMVNDEVFKEYRDARFMKEFADDPEKWALLKSGEKHIGHKLANDIKAGNSSLNTRIDALPGQIERALERNPESLDDDDVESLRKAVKIAQTYQNPGVDNFRLELLGFTKTLESASLTEIKSIQRDEMQRFEEALEDFNSRLNKHKTWE